MSKIEGSSLIAFLQSSEWLGGEQDGNRSETNGAVSLPNFNNESGDEVFLSRSGYDYAALQRAKLEHQLGECEHEGEGLLDGVVYIVDASGDIVGYQVEESAPWLSDYTGVCDDKVPGYGRGRCKKKMERQMAQEMMEQQIQQQQAQVEAQAEIIKDEAAKDAARREETRRQNLKDANEQYELRKENLWSNEPQSEEFDDLHIEKIAPEAQRETMDETVSNRFQVSSARTENNTISTIEAISTNERTDNIRNQQS